MGKVIAAKPATKLAGLYEQKPSDQSYKITDVKVTHERDGTVTTFRFKLPTNG